MPISGPATLSLSCPPSSWSCAPHRAHFISNLKWPFSDLPTLSIKRACEGRRIGWHASGPSLSRSPDRGQPFMARIGGHDGGRPYCDDDGVDAEARASHCCQVRKLEAVTNAARWANISFGSLGGRDQRAAGPRWNGPALPGRAGEAWHETFLGACPRPPGAGAAPPSECTGLAS